MQQNGDQFKIEDKVFDDTPALVKVRLDGNPGITSLHFLRTAKKLREILVDSKKGCLRCNYTLISKKQRCRTPGYCVDPQESPFGSDDCACVQCVSAKSRMAPHNCSQDHLPLAPRLMGDGSAVRIALWLISSLALVSNLALIVFRCYTHTLRRNPLTILIAGIALSNLFVTASVVLLLAADVTQSPEGAGALGQRHWFRSVCGPVYFLKHFGIYSLVVLLTLIVMKHYRRCFASLTVRRLAINVCEAWVSSFLITMVAWTFVTKWHRMCTASHETMFARVTYLISGCLVIASCLYAVVLVVVIFQRRTFAEKLPTRTPFRWELGMTLVAALTLLLTGVPHSVVVIGSFVGTTSPETGVEIVTILLMIPFFLYPVLLARYCPTMDCLSDSFSTSSMSCSCGKCKAEQYFPSKCSINSLRAPKSCITLSSFQGSCTTKKYSTTITSTSSMERMSQDSLPELDTWNSQTTKTKSWSEGCTYADLKRTGIQNTSEAHESTNRSCEMHACASRDDDEDLGNFSTALVKHAQCDDTESWVEVCNYDDVKERRPQARAQAALPTILFSEAQPCTLTCSNGNLGNSSTPSLERQQNSNTKSWIERCDYDDLKKIRNQSPAQAPKTEHGLLEVSPKSRALTWSDENDGTLTSVADDVFGARSVSGSSERTSSFLEAIHEHAVLAHASPTGESPPEHYVEAECQKTSDAGKKTRRLSSLVELLQRAFSSRRQRSKSLPENQEIMVNKVERSQSMPFEVTSSVRVSPESPGTNIELPQDRTEERLASFFILVPAKSPTKKTIFSPRKTKSNSVSSPSNSRKASLADRIAKSLSLPRRSPSHDEPAKTIALEEGDILTELPVMRRNKLRTTPRDPTARESTASNGSTSTRYSMEWDPIGSVEGYADREVLPPYPPLSLKNKGVPRFPQPSPATQAPARYSSGNLSERYSSYSLDWDPTSVQMRNSMISRDSLSYPSDDEGSMEDVGCEGNTEDIEFLEN